METSIAVFRGKGIRKTIHNNEWWFSIADVVELLTETANSSDYIKKMRKRDDELAKGWEQIATPPLVENIWFSGKQACCSQGRRGCRDSEKRFGTKDAKEGCLPRKLSGHSSEKTETFE